ncbi:hypothetical protein [Marinoscillum sp.]|uniref:hypothetical protein n=1 Tax=Marinoscillum sp. TaxID=2024838 RepID=UPI003BAC2942
MNTHAVKCTYGLVLWSLTLIPLSAQYISDDTYQYDEIDVNDWDHVYKYRIQLKNAYYWSGRRFIVFKIEDGKDSLKVLYPDGTVLARGSDFRSRRNKLVPKTGTWEVYHGDGELKESVSFRQGSRYGEYLNVDENGEILKEKYYAQNYSFGCSISFFLTDMAIESGPDTTMTTSNGYGWSTGFLIDYELNESITFRTLPMTAFYGYKIRHSVGNQEKSFSKDYTLFRMPILTVFKLYDFLNISVGVSPNFNLVGRNTDKSDPIVFSNKNFDLSAEFGVSHDIEFEMFTMIPQINYSRQLTNWADFKDAAYSKSVNKLLRNQISFSLIFSGRMKN